MRFFATAAVVLATFAMAGSAAAQSTTRIETRPYYGAVVTLEAGVRVFRPLPPPDRVIINPNGAVPLTLNINEAPAPQVNVDVRQSQYVRTYRGNRGRAFRRRFPD